MNRSVSYLIAMALSLSLMGCTSQQADQTADKTENAGETVAQSTENAAEGAGNAAETVGEAAGNAGEAAGNAAENVGSAAGNAAGSAAGNASNAGVTAKVKNALILSPTTKGIADKINVDTTDAQVTLTGHAHTQAEVQEAEKVAKAAAGNRTVVNQISVMQH